VTAPQMGDEWVVAAFDFDKTISTRDNVVPFVRKAVGLARVAGALVMISPRLVAAAFRAEQRDAAKAAFVRRTLTGYDAASLVEVADRFADRVIARHLRADVMDRVRFHQAQGHKIVLISASLAIYLDQIAAKLGFDAVLATRLAIGDDGRLTGELIGANVRGAEKVRRLDAWLADRPAYVWAYGDSSGDRELFARADQAVRV
jgi:phosphatidylglycerophosphatase C